MKEKRRTWQRLVGEKSKRCSFSAKLSDEWQTLPIRVKLAAGSTKSKAFSCWSKILLSLNIGNVLIRNHFTITIDIADCQISIPKHQKFEILWIMVVVFKH